MSRRRAEELLALRAVEGLEDVEERELSNLLAAMPEVDDGAFEAAAAACHLALVGAEVPLPDALRQRLESDAAALRRTL